MAITLLSSPLQGYTDFRFRNAFQKYFGGIDMFYAPYIRMFGKMEIKNNYQLDIAHKNNTTINVTPQVMTCSADEFIFVTKYIRSLGYTELNWNLGCPYPMVTNKGLGSGLIADPYKIDRILDRVHTETDVLVSMKLRMGYDSPDEILRTYPVLNKYPLKNIAIHARIGKQLYKGGVDLDSFERCLEGIDHPVYYNGDITSLDFFNKLRERFPSVDHYLLGRGLIANPFLPMILKSNNPTYPEDRLEIFYQFHNALFDEFERKLSGAKHVIMKMSSFWGYFETSFPDFQRPIKKIKKTKTTDDYFAAVDNFMDLASAKS